MMCSVIGTSGRERRTNSYELFPLTGYISCKGIKEDKTAAEGEAHLWGMGKGSDAGKGRSQNGH